MDFSLGTLHDLTFIFTVGIFCAILYLLFFFRNKSFLSFDKTPRLLSFRNLRTKNDLSKIPVVKSGLVIETFPVIDIKTNRFEINGLVWFRFNRSLVSLESVEKFSFLNVNRFEKSLFQVSTIDDDFLVQYKVHMEFYSYMDHHFFPLNDHSIFLVMVNNELTAEEIIFESNDGSLSLSKDMQIDDWNIVGSSVQSGYEYLSISETSSKPIPFPRILYTLNIKKSGLRKLSSIVFPIVLIFLISAFSLLTEQADLALKLSLGALIAMFMYRYILNLLSPNVGYLTLAEYLYNFCLGLVFVHFLIVFADFAEQGHIYFAISLIALLIYSVYLLFFRFFKVLGNDSEFNFLDYINKVKVPELSQWNLARIKKNYHLYQMPMMSFIKSPVMSWRYILKYMQHYQTIPQDLIIQASITSKCVTFVNLPANTHEFFENLEELIRLNILDKDLVLSSPYDFIIFHQHICKNIDELEKVFPIVLLLMLKNPQQVHMLQDFEFVQDMWQDNLKYDYVKKLFRKYPEQFENLVKDFFAKLPRQILLEMQYPDSNYVVQFLSENSARYFDNHPQQLEQIIPSETIEARILNLNSHIYHGINQCLLLKMPYKNCMRWFLSCGSNEYDELAMISFHPSRKGAYLDWRSRLKASKKSFKSERYHLSYGFKIKDNISFEFVDDKPLRIASSMDLSQSLQVFSTNIARGMSLASIQQNALGGVNQQALKLLVHDDKYNPNLSLANLKDFLAYGMQPGLALGTVGTPTLEGLLPLIHQDKLFVFFPITGANHLRVADNKNILFFRASYQTEAQMIVHDLLNINHCKRIGILYQNDSFGLSLLNVTKSLLDKNPGDHVYVEAPYQRNNPNIGYAANIIKQFNPDALIFFAVSAPSISLVHELGISQIADMRLYISSPGNLMLVNFLKTLGLSINYCSTVPPLTTNMDIVREYYGSYQNVPFAFDPNLGSLEGYINASLMAHILSQITPPYSSGAILEVVSSFENYDFKGLTLNFNPDTRELFNQIWLVSD